jgi:hypothetical protein
MNIWLALDLIENKNVEEIAKKVKALKDLNGKDYPMYFKVFPSHLGCKTVLCVDDLSIEVDITNYNSW